ncbi:MAG TPA: HD-GYP domain-containing protein [Bryobacteraceae bacterium]|nr:HD-GYP domain-containing protein [Bryobacteraceae bacterium]
MIPYSQALAPFAADVLAGGGLSIAKALAQALAQALDARDSYTAGHSLRVAEHAYAMAEELRLPEGDVEIIRLGAWLHDVGKIGIPDAVLQKAGPLTAEELGLVKLHPQIGRKILERAPGFEPLLDSVELHHEDFDGGGYPYGLVGQRIPLAARVIRVADAFDAMTSDRAYRPGLTAEAALKEIESGSGRQFDPSCAAALLRVVRRRGRREIGRGTDLLVGGPSVAARRSGRGTRLPPGNGTRAMPLAREVSAGLIG